MSKLYFRKTELGTWYYKDPEMTIFHRENGPAIERFNGDKEWYQNDKLHRPTIEYTIKEWWQNGKLHRLDGPAIEWRNGDKEWWQDGKYHRLDGPARELTNGIKEYWYQGKRFPNIKTNEQWKKHFKWMKFS